MAKLKLIGYIFMSAGVVILGSDYFVFQKTQNFLSESVQTEGLVIQLIEHTSNDSSNPMHHPLIEFQDASGQRYGFESSFGSYPPRYEVGQKIKVRFNPENPSQVHIDTFMHHWLAVVILTPLGLLFVIPGSIPWIFLYLKQRRINRLEQFGTFVSSRLLSVESDPYTTINGKHPWRIKTEWINPKTNLKCIFRSPALDFDPTRYLERDHISVRIDPDHVDNYSMDLTFLPSNSST